MTNRSVFLQSNDYSVVKVVPRSHSKAFHELKSTTDYIEVVRCTRRSISGCESSRQREILAAIRSGAIGDTFDISRGQTRRSSSGRRREIRSPYENAWTSEIYSADANRSIVPPIRLQHS